ncbi:hypothetical protein JAB5_12660 [Janthinobacterium sp. HH103]|uniref:hypothetical protein n=1 Tax=unclassified Janthinobacterium TaxID=2610881 RepID=UPI000892F624|nr:MULTISPECIES: hypothetical protein [unclassified Janthinobacterium]OEZ65266.1 hypothetical protein JAB2_36640 [Janthinobacterium sp. HH100]OEZ84466.1 hypothetical protein JAB5_12660 [Janthinobacterium sp. HH103]QOU71063.1 hypothetical protein JAB4_004580 [Janthinobacterium sp. HH102]
MNSDESALSGQLEAVATACLIALIAGILLPKALFFSLDRAILVWLVTQVASGLVVGNVTQSTRKLIVSSSFPAAALPIGYCGFLVVRWLVDLAKNLSAGFKGFNIPIFGLSGVGFGPPDLVSLTILTVLAVVGFLASFVLILVSAFASRSIQRGIIGFYSFGPDGLRRVQRLLLGLVAVIGGLVLLWGSFGV